MKIADVRRAMKTIKQVRSEMYLSGNHSMSNEDFDTQSLLAIAVMIIEHTEHQKTQAEKLNKSLERIQSALEHINYNI
jgi:hypothetical protein